MKIGGFAMKRIIFIVALATFFSGCSTKDTMVYERNSSGRCGYGHKQHGHGHGHRNGNNCYGEHNKDFYCENTR